MATEKGLSAFVGLLRIPGAAAFSVVGVMARLPIAMIGLGIVLLVTSTTPSYATAGALAASFALAAAVLGPIGARFIDRLGQRRVLPLLAAGQAAGLLLLVTGLSRGWPWPLLFAIAIGAGGIGPNIGSLVRARWIALLHGDARLRAAFAWESIVDEVIFILGPPLATGLALGVAPAAPLLASAALVLAGSLLLAAQRATDPPPSPVARGSRTGHAARLGGMPAIIGLTALLGAVFGSLEVTTVAYAAEQGAPQAAGLVLALYAGGSLIGGLLIGTLRPAATVTRQLVYAAALLAVVTAPLPLVPGLAALSLLALAAGLAVAPVLILATSLVELLVPPARITEALTVTSSGIAVGLAVAAPLAGAVIDSRGASSGYVIMSASALGALILMLFARRGLLRRELAATPDP